MSLIRSMRLLPSPLLQLVARRPLSTATGPGTSSISAAEIAHFSALSSEWWNPEGEFGLLHRMNPARVEFLRDSLLWDAELPSGARWLRGKNVLDVGCGGGIFAEALARLGADTLAIDAAAQNITIASLHASQDPALSPSSPLSSTASHPSIRREQLEYRHCAAEDLLAERDRRFDVVCGMEVVEHVENPREFLDTLGKLTKPGGHLLLSTISRTPLAHLLTLTLAEQVLRLVTPSTHTYSKYIKPSELAAFFTEPERVHEWEPMTVRGCIYDPLKGGWRLLLPGQMGGLGEQVNYFAGLKKKQVV